MIGHLMSVDDATGAIASGRPLLLAGDEQVLRTLPSGNWIGGTIPYFMADEGGLFTQSRLFVTELPGDVTDTAIGVYDESSLQRVYDEIPDTGFGILILPAFSAIHSAFALNAPNYAGFATKPLVGWVSGVAVEDVGRVAPLVFDGRTNTAHAHHGLMIRATLAPHKAAEIGIVNIFWPGAGDTLTFPENGFSVSDVLVNGVRRNFAEYIRETGYDIQLPLVANYGGAMINVCFRGIDDDTHTVHLYGPVFHGVEYRHSRPIVNYVDEFTAQVPRQTQGTLTLSCNCVLNYLYSELEGKRTGAFVGPCTFGEIAYQLLNQTLVYLSIVDVADGG